MAIKKIPKMANQFWPSFIRRQITQTILVNLLIALSLSYTVYTILRLTGIDAIYLQRMLVAVGAISILNLFFNLYSIIKSTIPLRDLLSAILSTSDEHTNLTPPNPNDKKYERNGLKDALQIIYEISSQKNPKNNIDFDKIKTKLDRLNEALDNTSCGFVVMNSDQKITYANKSAPIYVDKDGKQKLELLFNQTDDLNSWINECVKESIKEDKIWTRVPDKLPNEEGRRFFDIIASYQKGLSSEIILTMIDRTQIYAEDEENLDFISFAAHELRGPITVIKGYVDILQDELADVLQGDQVELFRRLAVSSSRLSGYIDNILNTSRYDRRHLKMNLVEDTVKNVYAMIEDDMQLRASSQGRVLSTQFPEDLPTIAADRASLSEVLGNLIDNAIKYSYEGGVINVTAKVNGDFVEVAVQDNGIGMPESVVSNLFQKFYRSHRSRETVAGTGIGLYISKAIVESHGGNISVRSQDGHGSTFTVSIPIYSTVAEKLQASNNSNEGLISEGQGWIKNHSMYRS